MKERTVARVHADDLAFFIVWEPVLPADDVDAAKRLAQRETDGRVHHYWDTDLRLGHAYAEPLDSPYRWDPPVAWDVVLLFDRNTRWTSAPPKPVLYRFPQAQPSGVPAWNAEAFADAVRDRLARR